MRPLTRSFFLLLFPGRLSLLDLPLLLGTCLPSLWIPPLLLHSDPPLSRQGMALAHLNSLPPHDLVLWTDGSIPIPFGKGGLAYLPTAFFVALRPLLFFRQAQYVQVFPLKPAPSCKLFAGLGSTNEVCHFSSLSLTLALSSPPCPLLRLFFYVNLCGRSGRKCLLSPPVLSDYNGSPDTHSFRGNNAADKLARRGALLVPSAVLCSLSPLTSRIHSPLCQTGGVLSHRISSTNRFPRFPLRVLCSYVTLSVPPLDLAATDTGNC